MTKTPQPETAEFIYLADTLYSALNHLNIKSLISTGNNKNARESSSLASTFWLSTTIAGQEKSIRYVKSYAINSDKNDFIEKEGIRLNAAIFNIKFSLDESLQTYPGAIKEYDNSFPFDNQLVARISKDTKLSKFFKEKKINFDYTLEWKAYVKEIENDIIYFHFPKTDTWVSAEVNIVTDHSSVFTFCGSNDIVIVDQDSRGYHPGELEDFEGKFHENHERNFSDKDLLDVSNVELYNAKGEALDNFKENQEDPFFDPDSSGTSPLHFISGSEEELERMIRLICHAGISIDAWDKAGVTDFSVFINSSTDDGEGAVVDFDNMKWYDEWPKIKENITDKVKANLGYMFDIAIEQNTPCGHEWEYNDGAYDRRSGYDKRPHRLDISVSRPSAHEQIGAKMELMKLHHIFGKDAIDELLNNVSS